MSDTRTCINLLLSDIITIKPTFVPAAIKFGSYGEALSIVKIFFRTRSVFTLNVFEATQYTTTRFLLAETTFLSKVKQIGNGSKLSLPLICCD